MVSRTTLDPGAAWRCAYRTVLEHDAVDSAIAKTSHDDTIQRRFDAAGSHRRDVAATLLERHGQRAINARRDANRTLEATSRADLDVIVDPSLPVDLEARRHGAPALLVADRSERSVAWRAVDVHNHFLTTEGAGSFLASALDAPSFEHAAPVTGRRLRKGGAWRRDVLRLAHHFRRLESLGVGVTRQPAGGVIDRGGTLWWLNLDGSLDDRGAPLVQYDARFAERVALLDATEARALDPSRPRPGAPWWHRECEECPFATTCHSALAAADDVSLVRYTDAAVQTVLRDLGVATRRSLATLDLTLVARGTATRDEPGDAADPVAVAVGRRVHDAGRLVRRARVEVAGSMLRLVEASDLDAHRADVEVDFDMESYDNATYLWGSLVTARVPTPGVVEGYRAFAEWGELTERSEGELFATFYAWLADVVGTARAAGRTVGLYCFWEHAERAQMRRAMASGVGGLPSPDELHDTLLVPLVDMHKVVTSQIQTSGLSGLKVVATAAGFEWRDEAPSGEASMAWYEEARADDGARANAATQRLLAYNEDDCRATRALRDWLEGAARDLPDVEGARPAEP